MLIKGPIFFAPEYAYLRLLISPGSTARAYIFLLYECTNLT